MSSSIRHTFLETIIDEKKFLGKLPIKLLGLHFIKPLLGFRTIFPLGELSEK